MTLLTGIFLFSIGLWILRRATAPEPLPRADTRYLQLNDDYQRLTAKYARLQRVVNELEGLYKGDQARLNELMATIELNSELNSSILKDVLDKETKTKAYIFSTLAKYGVEHDEIKEIINGIYE